MLGFFYFGCQIRVEILLFRVEILLFRVEIPDFGFPLFWCLFYMQSLKRTGTRTQNPSKRMCYHFFKFEYAT